MRLTYNFNDIRFFHCCTCNKTVDRVESYRNHITCDMEFIVYCHGKKETANLPDYILYDTIDIVEARCFTQGKLTHDNSN